MKKAKFFLICALALVMGAAANASNSPTANATALFVRGKCLYQHGNSWLPVKANMQFGPGVVFCTRAHSSLDLTVNGSISTVRIEQNSTLAIPEINRLGAGRHVDTQTVLDLRKGTVMGDVHKLSSNSRYQIQTPHGTAGIQSSANFHVIADLQTDGHCQVTFTSVLGEMLVSAQGMPNSPNVIKVLKGGRSWMPGQGDIHQTPRDLLRQYQLVLDPRWAVEGPAVVQGPGPIVLDPFEGQRQLVLDPFSGAGQPMTPQTLPTVLPGNSKK